MEVGDVASLMPWPVWMDLTGRSMIRVAEGTGSTKDDVLWPAEMEVHPRLYGSKDNNGEQPRGRRQGGEEALFHLLRERCVSIPCPDDQDTPALTVGRSTPLMYSTGKDPTR